MKLGRRQKRILKRKLKRIAGDVVAVIVGAGMFVGLFVAWANEPMPDWSEYIEENHIGMVQVEGSDTWLTQEEYEQMCKERDAYKAAEQAEEQSYYNAILQSTETPVPTTTAAIGSLDWDADDSYRLAKIAMAEAEGEDTEGKALVILVVLNRVWSDDFPDTIEGVITEDTQFAAYENGRYDRVEPDADCYRALEMVQVEHWDESRGATYMDNITMSLGIYFEVKDAEIYGGEGTVGYAATIVDISLSGLQKADFTKYAESQKEGMAQFCHVPVEKVRVISRDEYEENTD